MDRRSKEANNVSKDEMTDALKSKFRKTVLEHSKNGTLVAVNKKMIFKNMASIVVLMEEIGKIFLTNIQINEDIIYMNVTNWMILTELMKKALCTMS